MQRFKRIAHRGWLRRAVTVFTFGYFPYSDNQQIHADWCVSGAVVNDWTLSAATLHGWTASIETAHKWTLTAEVLTCG